MAERLHKALMALRYEDDFPPETLADLAGCSPSLIYTWSDLKAFETAKAKYLFALAARLAERYGNYRLVQVLLPPIARISLASEVQRADGNIEDEATDATLAIAEAIVAHRGRNPDALAAARAELRAVEQRIGREEEALRGGQAASAE